MAEYNRNFFKMCGFQFRRRFNPVVISVGFAAGFSLALRHFYGTVNKPAMTEQTAVRLPAFRCPFIAVALKHCSFFVRQKLCILLRLAVSSPLFEVFHSPIKHKAIHFIFITALKKRYIFRRSVCVSLVRVKRQNASIPYWEYA